MPLLQITPNAAQTYIRLGLKATYPQVVQRFVKLVHLPSLIRFTNIILCTGSSSNHITEQDLVQPVSQPGFQAAVGKNK